MAEVQIDSQASAKSSPISLSEGLIRIRHESTFGLAGQEFCNRFLKRVLEIEEVRSVTIDRVSRLAAIRHEVDFAGLPGLLTRLASAIRGETNSSSTPNILLPSLPSRATFSIHRYGSRFTTWEVVHDAPGWLRLRHEALRGDRVVADRIESTFAGMPGVRIAKANERTGLLLIRFDPTSIAVPSLIALAESTLREPEPRSPAMPVKFGLANLSLGIAAAGEFFLPALLPVSAVLLVGMNVRTFRAACLQLKNKRLGLPVLYIAIVATSLATGQFLASALMTWLFRFWHRRFRAELASERSRLIERPGKEALMARLLTPSGAEVLVAVDRLKPDDRLIVASGETIPADCRILAGEGVVDERGVRGLEGISRKRVGDPLLAGSTVLAGSFHLEVARVGEETRAASIRRALVAATSPAPGSSAPTARSESFASKAVGPTLATAGVGLLAGDLLAVGAILRPDYATGPGLAVPLETLHKVALCARLGIVARDPDALERLAQVDLFVLEDQGLLGKTELDVAKIDTRMPEEILLRYASSAFRHLVDDRATALVGHCHARRIPLLKLDPLDFGRGVTVTHGKHRIRVADADPAAGPAGPLAVEIDGNLVSLIEFSPTNRLEARTAIDRIRRASHVPFALVSPRTEAESARMARSLGVEIYRGEFRPADTADFLAACQGRGLKTSYVGDCRANPKAAAEAHVAISFAEESDIEADPAGLLMQRPRLELLADLHALSRTHATRVNEVQQFILIPNLLCVAGAFFFGFTGMTAVMLSNLGTLGLYRRASGSLRGLDSPGLPQNGQPRRAG